MQNKYCLPIIKTNTTDVLSAINQAPEYDYYEIWLDYIEDLNEQFINELIGKYGTKLVLLFRRQNLEPVRLDLQKRVAILENLHNKNIFVDLDITSQENELRYIREKSLKIPVIVSYHNYQETPDNNKIQDILHLMQEYSPAIVKIATQCNNDKDALLLMSVLQQLKQNNQQYIVLGMGELGKITRIYGLIQGNVMHFAPLKIDEKSAPGQLTRDELQTIMKIMEGIK